MYESKVNVLFRYPVLSAKSTRPKELVSCSNPPVLVVTITFIIRASKKTTTIQR
jgi:hypothetical protein